MLLGLDMEKSKRRALLSWLSVGALLVLCGVLGVFQYRWIGEVSVAERERLRASLQASLNRLSQDFNAEITTACAALWPGSPAPDEEVREKDYARRYLLWKSAGGRYQLLRRIAIAAPEGDALVLRSLDLDTGAFGSSDLPPSWEGLWNRITAWGSGEPWQGRRPPGPLTEDEGLLIELPRFERPPPGPPQAPSGRRPAEWLILEVDLDYVRADLLPELLQRHLESGGRLDYQVEVETKATPPTLIYQSDPGHKTRIRDSADASVSLFEVQFDRIFQRMAPRGRRDGGPGGGPALDRGRWQLFARHRAGSLEALVSRAQWRNLAVTAGILTLVLATVAALVRYTRQAQRLAELQMDFLAGVSHELRTPLTVIQTAAYNLRRRAASNPSQVERYGALIQQEGEKLTALVEHVVRYASAKAGRVIREREPLSVEAVIDDSVLSSRSVLEESRCVVERTIEPGLPLILGDPLALRHALQNLISNAARHGAEGSNWIGVFASQTAGDEQAVVEIRVADRGPGIPPDEQRQVFDPFYRGKRALQDQIRGTGLGLSLTKAIVEAHGGTVTVTSEPAKRTEFVIRIPAAPEEYQDEFTYSPG